MTAAIALGGGGLGIAIAWLVIYFLDRFEAFNVTALGSVVFVVAGGTVTTFLGTIGAADKLYAWVGYCLGLCMGVLYFGVIGIGRESQSKSGRSGVTDPRLQMLDHLRDRYLDGTVTYAEYDAAKEKILADIKNTPEVRKAPTET